MHSTLYTLQTESVLQRHKKLGMDLISRRKKCADRSKREGGGEAIETLFRQNFISFVKIDHL